MNGMQLRLEAKNLYLRVANVTRDNKSYVLLTAYDDTNNEFVLELTHEQAGWLEDQFYAANRRYEERLTNPQPADEPVHNPILAPTDRQEPSH
ncbi:hypothetical protein [Pseudobacillus badius]|uniref:hypothetical protein n=1 Tax=Bacillus badius TaxID=1455 RepID=UPI001CBD1890|nr:hypothetical protein [Bacillus badius]MED0667542.1 hypothetical protein [Bacillus badius]UAT29028.1 hypothetical protein K7T73_10350 [Bacillus badius]GLY12555.1 hypothetical protein Bbad01_37710 [Bacillus badius]